jgi:hypothetical protein
MNLIYLKMTVIEVELISLKARKKKAEAYIMNNDMLIESELLQGQIKALEDELFGLKETDEISKNKISAF